MVIINITTNLKKTNFGTVFNLKNFLKFTCVIFTFFLIYPVSVSSALADANLVANPGFENGSTTPLSWTFVTTGGNTPLWDTISHSGARSVRMQIGGTRNKISGNPRSDLISAQPLSNYTLSAWGKTKNTGGNAPAVRVVELDAGKNLLTTNILYFSKGTNNWAQKQIDFQTGSKTAYIYVYANIRNGYGTFWVDDVAVSIKTSTPTPIVTPTLTPTPSPTAIPPTPTVTPSITPIFEDQFSGSSLNSSTWPNIYNGVASLYGSGGIGGSWFLPANAVVNGGQLHLIVKRENYSAPDYYTYPYTSAGISGWDSEAGFGDMPTLSTGRWEVRARMPETDKGLVFYAALWYVEYTWPPELDFIENDGYTPNSLIFTQHYGYPSHLQLHNHTSDTNTTEWHIYAVEMGGGTIKYYIDDTLVGKQTKQFADAPMYMSMGVWAGSCTGGWGGCPKGTTMPQQVDIDYVRIYNTIPMN